MKEWIKIVIVLLMIILFFGGVFMYRIQSDKLKELYCKSNLGETRIFIGVNNNPKSGSFECIYDINGEIKNVKVIYTSYNSFKAGLK